LFAAFNILNGKVIGSCLPRHRGKEFIKFLHQLEKEVPPDLDIHLIVVSTSISRPTSSSWPNQVERWFGLIADKMIRRGTFHSVSELERAICAWLQTGTRSPSHSYGQLPRT
jgi:putative transposase